MERLKRDGRKDGGKGEPIAPRPQQREKKSEERGREQKSDSLTAAPNGFSGEREREGAQRRRRHNEGAMTEAEIDLER